MVELDSGNKPIQALVVTQELAAQERQSSEEVIPQQSRVVIYGCRVAGAFLLGEVFDNYLKVRGLDKAKVTVERDPDFIEEAFYDNYPMGTSKVRRVKLLSKDPLHYYEFLKDNGSIPVGVIVLPEMWWEDQWVGENMFVHTYGLPDRPKDPKDPNYYKTAFEEIEELCIRHNVPLAAFNEVNTREEIEASLSHLLTG